MKATAIPVCCLKKFYNFGNPNLKCMIQRIQSVYLLLITIVLSFLLVKPYAGLQLSDGQELVFRSLTIRSYDTPETWTRYKTTVPLFALIIITGSLSFLNIFLFSKRQLQMRLCIADILLLIIILVTMYIYYSGAWNSLNTIHHSLKGGAIFPLIGILMNFLAYRAIQSDKALVDSYNRIR